MIFYTALLKDKLHMNAFTTSPYSTILRLKYVNKHFLTEEPPPPVKTYPKTCSVPLILIVGSRVFHIVKAFR